ncbi:FHF complex subunit HOOK interacting protein 1B-like isoform X4 [Mercenaria mercenaria]|uniref:FHF complex subunit HOOK interacting protein 1B-like isoform X4 n=1 Tax=Mercenaria mercenaria TaxID=6596 RepID=UPI00234E4D0A|nr:FHF complex subunit HOOK interacting protein 1B-like isoform X4 [Mercenaria mercenaria]
MSWFKKRTDSKNSSDASSVNSEGPMERRSRRDTDPATCLEVFRNHWDQAYNIISRDVENGTKSTDDEINTVSHNFEQMITLLAGEAGEDGQGMPGPILHYLLEHEILEKFCGWCHRYHDDVGKLVQEQLRMFEHLISQSNQLLLIHKPVIRPLLNLLAYCSDDNTSGIEASLVLVLHQLCVSISKETVILESVFNMNADHGPTKFLIFSLLIPYLHREGKVGQQARDALLLIMTMSSKHPYIGIYIAENSDFCPVLATGLSGLYSDLPRKIVIPSENWCQITDDDVQNIPEMAMFLNSLEFCNAVAQDISGLPTPLLDSPMFSNSREEVITATAYLDLFLRKISEPCLVKAFLMFIFTEKNDEIVILDSLITRINSSSKLCLVSLSLFYTLIDLNCEDAMFDLVFRYLIPCTHVMISQRRSVRDHDIYCRSAEKFLSLRPTCCLPEIDSPKHKFKTKVSNGLGDLPGLPTNNSNSPRLPKVFRSRKDRNKKQLIKSEPVVDQVSTAFPPGTFGSKLEHFETTYLEYLQEARVRLKKCNQACRTWQYLYDGENPAPTCLGADVGNVSHVLNISVSDSNLHQRDVNRSSVSDEERERHVTDSIKSGQIRGQIGKHKIVQINASSCDSSVEHTDFNSSESAIARSDIEKNEILQKRNMASYRETFTSDKELMQFLDESGSPSDKSVSLEESVKCLDTLLSCVSASISRTSTPRKDLSNEATLDSNFGEENEMSTVYYDCETSQNEAEDVFKSINETSYDIIDDPTKSKINNATEFEIVDSQSLNNNNVSSKSKNMTSFVDITSEPDQSVLQPKNQERTNELDIEKLDDDALNIVDDHYKAQVKSGILVTKSIEKDATESSHEQKDLPKGDKSVRFAADASSAPNLLEFSSPSVLGVGMTSVRQSTTPNIGPFLMAVLLKLEGMMQNSLPVNLMLTGLISRLAVYRQPLLRSFLLNNSLVFQPTVKSLVQVLTSVRQKVDHYSYTVQNFEALLLRARRTLAQREGLLPERGQSLTPSPELVHNKLRASTVTEIPSKEKRHRTLSELLFRRNPNDKKMGSASSAKGAKLEILAGNKGMRYINRKQEEKREQQVESVKTRNAVYCAIVLEEFVKELAALSQEHALLIDEDEWCER